MYEWWAQIEVKSRLLRDLDLTALVVEFSFLRERVMRVRHAYSGFIYESNDDGTVGVSDPKTGHAGVFTRDAVWISGDLKYGDHHLIGHVGGKTAEGATSLGEFSKRVR